MEGLVKYHRSYFQICRHDKNAIQKGTLEYISDIVIFSSMRTLNNPLILNIYISIYIYIKNIKSLNSIQE